MAAQYPSSDRVSEPGGDHDPYQIYSGATSGPIQDPHPTPSSTAVGRSAVTSGLWWSHLSQYAASFALGSTICLLYTLFFRHSLGLRLTLLAIVLLCGVAFFLGKTLSGPRFTRATQASSDLHQYRVTESATVPCQVFRRRAVSGLTPQQMHGIWVVRNYPAAMICQAALPDGTTRTVLSLVPGNLPIPTDGSSQRIRLHPTVGDAGLLTGEAAAAEEVQAVRRFGLYPASRFTTFVTIALGYVGGTSLGWKVIELLGG